MASHRVADSFFVLGAFFAGTAVAAGAFGAHLLKPVLDAPMLAVFETAARYQMYHALALCLVSSAGGRYPNLNGTAVGWLFTAGILLFSGSLYALSLVGIPWSGGAHPVRWSRLYDGLGLSGVGSLAIRSDFVASWRASRRALSCNGTPPTLGIDELPSSR